MKLFIALVVLALLACQMLFCAEPAKHNDSTFQKLEGCNVEITVPGISFRDPCCLTPGVVLACGDSTFYPECYLYVIDTDSMKVIYASDVLESGDGYWLYQWETENHVVVLQESPTEFSSILGCFVLDVRNREFRAVGEFEVCLPFPKYAEGGYDYPVDQIRITSTDTLVTFRFLRRLELRPTSDDGHEADSAIYQLNLRADSLKLIFPRK